MRARHGDSEQRARARRSTSRGSASVEYGLIVGLIGAVLCLGIGVTMRDVFQHTIDCFIAQIQGGVGPADCDTGPAVPPGGEGGGGDGGGGDSGGEVTPRATPSPTPTVTPTPTPDPTPPAAP